jgi:NADPH:quinone reductase
MKSMAALLVEHGRPLRVAECDLPVPSGDEAEIDMLYGGVNPVDLYRAAGTVDADSPIPRTLGAEGAGTLDGRPVVVFGHGVGRTRDGIWATRAIVPRAALIDVPAGIDLQRAAVMGVAGVTAWRTVTELAQVAADDRVLVLGAAGGVGSIIVSLAHRLGATVWGHSADPDAVAWLQALGADRVVTASAEGLASELEPFRPTVAFDPLGDGFTGAVIRSLAPQGRLVTFGTSAGPTGMIELKALYRSALRILGYGGLRDSDEILGAALAKALSALADGWLEVAIGKILPLSQVNAALDLLAAPKVRGKVVLDLQR